MINKKLKKLILNSQVISFDLYDTLLYRKVSPKDVFKLVAEIYNKNNDKYFDFATLRIKAEDETRKKKRRGEEVTLDEIYSVLKEKNSQVKFDDIKKIEIEVEKKIVYLNSEVKEIFDYCLRNNKKIIITSDIYLPFEVINEIMQNMNLNYAKLFLSSNIGLKKSTGKIFEKIKTTLKVNYDDILHIGDNFNSDYFQPKLKGIHTYKIKSNKRFYSAKKDLLNSYLKDNITNLSDFGYNFIGPIIFEFCKYIKTTQAKNLIFLAREGKFIKECYDYMYPNDFTNYLYISRKSITNAAIYDSKIRKKVINLQSINQNENVEEFLNRLSILNAKNIQLLKENNIDLNDKVYGVKAKIIKLSPKFNINPQNNILLNKYLSKFPLNPDSIIIDIGWKGTMQDILELYHNQKINGIYFGLRKKRSKKNKSGFLFDGNNPKREKQARGMVDFLEVIFAADHGTTLGYIVKGKKVIPQMADNDLDEELFYKVRAIQLSALKFIQDNINDYFFQNLDFAEETKSNLLNIGSNPSSKILNMFNKFYTYDEKRKYFLPQKNFIYYLFHLKELVNDFIDSGWKYGFLKRIFKCKFITRILFNISYKLKK